MLTLYRVLKFIFRYVVPVRLRYPAARVIARFILWFNAGRRRTLIANLTPLVGTDQARRRAPELMGNFLMTAVDFFCPSDLDPAAVPFESWSTLEKAYRRNRKVILVTAHLGNWELGMSCLVERGFSVAGVYAPYRKDRIVKWILAHRNSEVEWIAAARGAVEACVAALERGRILGMVADIPFAEKGHRVHIAGQIARLPLGPWAIAVRAGAVVIPAFMLRDRPGVYHAVLHDPIAPPGGSFRHQIESMQEIFRGHLESYLRRYPAQWGVLQHYWDAG